MSGIFISYRRSGASVTTYRLADELKRAFGESSVFLDVESIEPGIPFAQAIQQALNKCSVALIIIGPQWLNMKSEADRRRLDDPDDWVRQEVKLALASRLRVIPVLVQGAAMPDSEQLPDDIKGLAGLHAFSIIDSQTHWNFDVQRLQNQIAEIDKKLAKKLQSDKHRTLTYSYKAIASLAIACLLLIVFASQSGWIDTDEAVGALVVLAVAIGLGFFGFKDARQGLKKGKGIAVAGMALSSLMVLATIGDMATHSAEYPAAASVAAAIEQSAATATQPDPPSVKSQSTKPVASTQSSKSKPVATIGGLWRSAQGVQYQITQDGRAVYFTEYNVFGVQVGEGEGTLKDNVFTFDYYNSLLDTTADGTGRLRGNAMTLNFTDQFGNTVSFQVFRE